MQIKLRNFFEAPLKMYVNPVESNFNFSFTSKI